jgi:alanyl-tRNA synthetase
MPEIYPWRPARWSLTNISTKKSKQRVLLNYYSDKIKYHNQLNREKWSIVISMEKDILFFISSIINFKDVITA